MPTLASRCPGTMRFLLAGILFALVPTVADAFTTRHPQRAGLSHGHRAQQTKSMRAVKRVSRKMQASNPMKTAPAAKSGEAAAPTKAPEHNGAWTAVELGGRACFRSRRKLWQADEGWVVKKVNVCP